MVTIHRVAAKGFRERAGVMLITGVCKEAFAKRVHIRECKEELWVNFS